MTSGNANSPVGPATGTITDNETKPTLTVGAGSLTEGDSGTANMSFTVTRSGDNTQDPINFSYTLGGGTATGGGVDYVSTGGTGSIASGGAGTTTINVPIVGDTIDETDETFQVTVTVTSGNANNPAGPATGTILDDDGKPTLTVGAGSLTEGEAAQPTCRSR